MPRRRIVLFTLSSKNLFLFIFLIISSSHLPLMKATSLMKSISTTALWRRRNWTWRLRLRNESRFRTTCWCTTATIDDGGWWWWVFAWRFEKKWEGDFDRKLKDPKIWWLWRCFKVEFDKNQRRRQRNWRNWMKESFLLRVKLSTRNMHTTK